jgi:GNAT superfamily N-acetyltransferase
VIRVRPAVRADIPALVELTYRCDLSQRAWAGEDLPMPERGAEALEWDIRFARTGAWIAVAEDQDGAIAGVVAFAAAQLSREDRTPVAGLGHVSAVFVDPDHWRTGIARRLLEAADAAMRAGGFDRAQLWTLLGSPAEALYRALGWQADGRRDVYPPMGLETVAYVKAL